MKKKMSTLSTKKFSPKPMRCEIVFNKNEKSEISSWKKCRGVTAERLVTTAHWKLVFLYNRIKLKEIKKCIIILETAIRNQRAYDIRRRLFAKVNVALDSSKMIITG